MSLLPYYKFNLVSVAFNQVLSCSYEAELCEKSHLFRSRFYIYNGSRLGCVHAHEDCENFRYTNGANTERS